MLPVTVSVLPLADIVRIPDGFIVQAAPEAAVAAVDIVILSPGKTELTPVNVGLGFTVRLTDASVLQLFEVPITFNVCTPETEGVNESPEI